MGIVVAAGINCMIPLVTELPMVMHGIAEHIPTLNNQTQGFICLEQCAGRQDLNLNRYNLSR